LISPGFNSFYFHPLINNLKKIWWIEKNKFIFAVQKRKIMQRNNLHIESKNWFSPIADLTVFGANYMGA
jgi:hypothetical protein